MDPYKKIVCDIVENVFFLYSSERKKCAPNEWFRSFFLINSIWIMNTLKL